jgi:hypothetical protein
VSAIKSAILLHLQDDTATGGVADLCNGRIYADVAPKGTSYPLVIVSSQRPPRAEWAFQGVAFEDSTYLVRAVDITPHSSSTVHELAQAIRARLNLASLTADDYVTRAVMFQGSVEYAEVQNSTVYQHEGGFYEVMAEEV